MLDLWHKNAVVDCLDVDTHVDSNGNGDREVGPIEDGELTAPLDGYAYRWYRLSATQR
jgi:hypothetical protein